MDNYHTIVFASTVTAVLIYLKAKCLRVGRRPHNFPPGPPTIPVLGNLHLVRVMILIEELISTLR